MESTDRTNQKENTIRKEPAAPLFTNAELIRLVVPLFIEQLLAVTVGMADTMMVSRCGEAAISGVSLVDMINLLIINIFAALATGGAVVVSQYLGAKEIDRANRSASQLMLLSVLLGGGVGLLCVLGARQLLAAVYGSIGADVLAAGVTYLRITALSYPFLAVYNAGAALARSMGDSKISMKVSVVMNVVNITGNAVCIFGLGMGVEGVAWPSFVSRAAAAVLMVRACRRPGNLICLRLEKRLDGPLARRILHIGIPSAFENSLFQGGRVLVVSIISTFGTVQIAANAVANNLDSMGCIPGQAMGLAMVTVVGRCIGALQPEQAVRYTRRLLLWAYGAMAASNGLILLFLQPLLGLYDLTADTVALAALLVQIHAGCGILLWPASFVLPNALRAANDVRFTMTVSVASMIVLRILLSYVLGVGLGLGALGVWYAMVADWVCRAACFVWRFRSGRRREKYQAG